MSDVAIAAIGAYTPRLRIDIEELEAAFSRSIDAGIERKAVPEADEDTLTMAYEAVDRALNAAGHDAADIAVLLFATTTPPMEEEDLTARLVSMFDVPGDVTTRTLTGSTRAGGQALASAVESGPWDDQVAVVVASDCPRGEPASDIEHAAGAGAAAVVLDSDGSGSVLDRSSYVQPRPGTRFRERGDEETDGLDITAYDRQSFTSVLSGAADALTEPLVEVDAAAVQAPDGKLPYRASGPLDVDAESIAAGLTVEHVGDTGAASPLLGAASAFEEGAERVLVAAYGSGAGADLLVLSGEVPVDTALSGDIELTYPEYLRRRGVITGGEPAGGGAYVSIPSWQRTSPQRHRLIAGRCPTCGVLNFPPSGVCSDCGGRPEQYENVDLPGTGTVELATTIAQGGAPPEFVEHQARSGPFVSAVVAFDGPHDAETVSVPAQVIGDEKSVSIGTEVAATIRRIYQQEGVVRYGFKAEPRSARR